MRLLEPLNGLKMAQGHAALHLTFFICMLYVDTDLASIKNPSLEPGDADNLVSAPGNLYGLNMHFSN